MSSRKSSVKKHRLFLF